MAELLEDNETDVTENSVSTPKRKRGRPPGSSGKVRAATSAVQYTAMIATALSGLSVLLALQTQHPPLMMTDQESREIAVPLGRIVARSSFAARYGSAIAGSNDYIALGMGLYHYGFRVFVQSQELAAKRAEDRLSYAAPHNVPTASNAKPNESGTADPDEWRPGINLTNLTPGRSPI